MAGKTRRPDRTAAPLRCMATWLRQSELIKSVNQFEQKRSETVHFVCREWPILASLQIA